VSLDLLDVWKSYGSPDGPAPALRGVDLSLDEGQVVAFVGHLGSGRTTLLNCAAGLIRPDRGTVSLDGGPLVGPGADRVIASQHAALLPRLSLLDNVRVAARAARPRDGAANDGIAEAYLQAVDLWEHRSALPAQVSVAMQRRAAVALALAVQPRVLFLDEPFAGLDDYHHTMLQELLLSLCGGPTGTDLLVLVPSGVDEALQVADRVVVLAHPPGPSVVADVEVEVPRNRFRVPVVESPAWRDLRKRLAELLGPLSPGDALVA
jgi:ABC-type nitrate/sulfonate/bicarbonate transport system ATPase subunit